MNLTDTDKKQLNDRVLKSMIGKDYFLSGPGGGFVKILEVVDDQTLTVVDKYGDYQLASIFDLRAV